MCILVTKHYSCVTRDGKHADPKKHLPATWIMPCSTPLVVTPEITDGAAQQPCLDALDEIEEYYSHPCPECTGRGLGSDDKPYFKETRVFPHNDSPENREAYDRAVHNYAVHLVMLYFAWAHDVWGNDGYDRWPLSERASIIARELLCREQDCGMVHNFSGPPNHCRLTSYPFANNFASQRRFDLALHSFEVQDEQVTAFGSRPMLSRTRKDTEAQLRTLAPWRLGRLPQVMDTVKPLEREEQTTRDLVLGLVMSEIESLNELDDCGPRGIIRRLIQNMSELLALDTGLTDTRARDILRWLGRSIVEIAMKPINPIQPNKVSIMHPGLWAPWSLIDQSTRWTPNDESILDVTWMRRFVKLMTANWCKYRFNIDAYGLYFYRIVNATCDGWETIPAYKHERRKVMRETWTYAEVRHRQLIWNVERQLVNIDRAQLPDDACCIICGSDFTSTEPPFDMPAALAQCAGKHPDVAGFRCLVRSACNPTTGGSCPYCRREFEPPSNNDSYGGESLNVEGDGSSSSSD